MLQAPMTSPMPSPDQPLHPPPSVRDIAERLEHAGFETWCVGGAVRDALLGHPHLDWDLATAATPDRVQALFRRTVPVGIEFGTVGVLDRKGVMHEVTTFRHDVRTDGRHAVVEFGASLDEDLARRDFTINAIAFSPRTNELRDPFGGRDDLKRQIIRAVGAPVQRMKEDRLRALRAMRFAGRFGFSIEPETWTAIRESAPFLPRLSRERVKQELEKTMQQVRFPSRSLALWRQSGALQVLIPELDAQPDFVLRAADFVGMPDATEREELASLRQLVRMSTLFLGLHPADARRVLRELRSSNRDMERIAHLAEGWRQLQEPMRTTLGTTTSDAALRGWIARASRNLAVPFLRATAARWDAARVAGQDVPAPGIVCRAFRRASAIIWRGDPLSIADLAIDGGDLLALGIPAGPRLGEILQALLEYVLEDPARNTREALLAKAAKLVLEPPER
jgi:tRNA nucleotidyltransferase (CCA-adding enzyme)